MRRRCCALRAVGPPHLPPFRGSASVTQTKNARGGAAHRVTLTVVASVSLQPARQRNQNIMLVLDDAAGLGIGSMRCTHFRAAKPLTFMVPAPGFEPGLPFGKGILSPLRLPVPPSGLA
jgi:hypothetical protein